MKNYFCPGTAKAKAEFEELSSVVGDVAAYDIWHQNNGYHIDKAPNGKDSLLFKTYLELFDNSRNLAIAAKAQVYTKSFKKWFGDWVSINDKFNEEIKNLKKRSQEEFHIERAEFFIKNNVSAAVDYYGEPKIFYHGSPNGYFDTFNKSKLGETTNAESAKYGFFFSNLYNTATYYAQENLQYRNIMLNLYTLNDSIKSKRLELNSIETDIEDYSKRLNELLIEIDTIDSKVIPYFNDINENISNILDYKQSLEIFLKSINDNKLINNSYKEEILLELGHLDHELYNLSEYFKKLDYNYIFRVFLNIRNPRIVYDIPYNTDSGMRRSVSYSDEIKKATKDNKDGLIIYNTLDPNEADVHVTFEPEQIKSSIGNRGTFSNDNPRIYAFNKSYLKVLDSISDEKTKSLLSNSTKLRTQSESLKAIISLSKNKLQVNTARSILSAIESGKLPNLPNTWEIGSEDLLHPAEYHSKEEIDGTQTGIIIRHDLEYLSKGSLQDVLTVMLHESTHSFNTNAILKNPKLYAYIKPFHDKFVKAFGVYHSLFEFVTALLSDPIISDLVESMNVNNKNKNFISKLINKLKSFWNSIIGKENKTVVDNIISMTNDYLKKPLKYNKNVNNINASGINEQSYNNAIINNLDNLSIIGKSNMENASNVVKSLKQSINNRIAAVSRRTVDPTIPRKLRELNNILESLDDVNSLYKFLEFVSRDMKEPLKLMVDAANNNKKLGYRELRQFRTDYIGFYGQIIPAINDLYLKGFFQHLNDGTPNGIASFEFIKSQLPIITTALNRMDAISKSLTEIAFREIITDVGESINNTEIDEYLDSNTIHTTNDLGWGEFVIGSMANANDYALKTIWKVLQDGKNEVARNSSKKGKALVDISKKVNVRDRLKLFELDSDGKRTGYIVRDKRYGEFKRDYRSFLDDLRNEFELDHTQLYPTTEDAFKEFNKRKNKWLSDNAHRRYIPEYYDLYANLSMSSTLAREEIQFEIDRLLSRAFDKDGTKDLMKLSNSQYSLLEKLLDRKRELSNLYSLDGYEKYGDELEIAKELKKLNEELKDKLNYKSNIALWEKSYNDALNRYGSFDSPDFKEWLRRNSRIEYSDNFWDMLDSIDKKFYGENYAKLEDQRREILSLYRHHNRIQIRVDMMPQSHKDLVKYLDKAMFDIRNGFEQEPEFKESYDESLKFKDIAEMKVSQEYKDARDEARMKSYDNPDAWVDFLQENHYVGSNGDLIPYSYWRYISPKDPANIEIVPNSNWQEIDKDSPWYNKNYDEEAGEYIQPKDPKYDNKDAFDEVLKNKNLASLREALIESYAESNDKLVYRKSTDPYKMAQISGSMWQFIKGKKSLRKGIGAHIVDGIIINSDDLDYSQSIQSPNGEQLYFIPTHFLKDLDDPTTITNDIVGGAISYWQMAENYRIMNNIAPRVELIKDQLGLRKFDKVSAGKTKATNLLGTDSRAYKKAELFLNMNLYGNKKERVEVKIPKTNKVISISKLMTHLKNYTQTVNLGWNITAMEVGYLTGLHHSILASLVGQYYKPSDFAWAFTNTLKNMFKILINWGNPNYNNKLMNLMEMNQISTTTDSMFDKLNYSNLGRFIMEHLWYGGFSGGDFVNKSAILGAVYNNHRLYTDPDTGEALFISKNDFLMKYYPDNRVDGNNAWKLLKTTLYDAYEVKNGVAVVKSEFSDVVTKKLVDNVNNTIRYLSAKADGVLSDLDRGICHYSAYGQMFTMHRGWMFSTVSNRIFKKRGFNYQTSTFDGGEYREVLGWGAKALIARWKQGAELIKYGQVTTQVEKMDDITKYAFRMVLWEFAMLGAYLTAAAIWARKADDDDSEWIDEHVAYMLLRTTFEIRAQYSPSDVLNLVKSPTPAMGTINQWLLLLDMSTPDLYEDTKLFDPVTRGPYSEPFPGTDQDITQLGKTLIKVTPFKHIIEARDPNLKRKYLDNMIMR